MKTTADSNVLVRAMTGDDPVQARIAQSELAKADVVALTLPTLCELVWVLSRSDKIASTDIAQAIRRLRDATHVTVSRPATEAGLVLLDAGGDFADGVIAFEGSWLGADAFVSFEKKAVEFAAVQGQAERLLG